MQLRRVPCSGEVGNVTLSVRSVDPASGYIEAAVLDTAGNGKVTAVEARDAYSTDEGSWQALEYGWYGGAVWRSSGSLPGGSLQVRITSEDGEQVVGTFGSLSDVQSGSKVNLGVQFSNGDYRVVRAQAAGDEVVPNDDFKSCGEDAPSGGEASAALAATPCGQAVSSEQLSWWCSVFSWIPGVCDGQQPPAVPCAPPPTAASRPSTDGGDPTVETYEVPGPPPDLSSLQALVDG